MKSDMTAWNVLVVERVKGSETLKEIEEGVDHVIWGRKTASEPTSATF